MFHRAHKQVLAWLLAFVQLGAALPAAASVAPAPAGQAAHAAQAVAMAAHCHHGQHGEQGPTGQGGAHHGADCCTTAACGCACVASAAPWRGVSPAPWPALDLPELDGRAPPAHRPDHPLRPPI